MSVYYDFKINVVKRGSSELSSVDIVESFLKAGWSLYSEENKIIYTDVGDKDDYDFVAKPISKNEYVDIMKRKEKNGEIIALALFLFEENHRYRIDIMITPEFNVLVSPDDGTRKMIASNHNILDVNWYLCRILPQLSNPNMIVESFSFMQY